MFEERLKIQENFEKNRTAKLTRNGLLNAFEGKNKRWKKIARDDESTISKTRKSKH